MHDYVTNSLTHKGNLNIWTPLTDKCRIYAHARKSNYPDTMLYKKCWPDLYFFQLE
jgi:hypothetical protein